MQFVRLVNKDHRTFDFHQNNKKRYIQPGEDVMVPWDVATSLFGDPFTTDTPTDQARTRAWSQSSGMHGYIVGGMTNEEWEAHRPKIEVWDIESGERVFMVMEDPEGQKASGFRPRTASESNESFLLSEINGLKQQLSVLVGALTAQAQGDAVPEGQGPFPSSDTAPDTAPASVIEDAGPKTPGFDAAEIARRAQEVQDTQSGVLSGEVAFGGNILPVQVIEGPPPGSPKLDTSDLILKPSVGGAAPMGTDVDVLSKLHPTEDTPQTPPVGPVESKGRKLAARVDG